MHCILLNSWCSKLKREKKMVTGQKINKKEKGDALLQGCLANSFF